MSQRARASLRLLSCVLLLTWPLAGPAWAMPGGMGGLFSMGYLAFVVMLIVVGIGYVWAWLVSLYNLVLEPERRWEWYLFFVCLTALGAFILARWLWY